MVRAASIVALVALVFVTYLPVRNAAFLNYDDNEYVTANPHVLEGLTAEGVAWAFTHAHSSNWHPVTWIAHMVDVDLYGAEPSDAGRHHLANVFVHAVATVLLAWLGFTWTGRWWASLLVAALFGLHPLHVESVAWISERKDTLSAVFGFATLLAWTGYVRRGGAGRYALTTVLLALGLMTKPILVTWPLVMLVLEFWPLRRDLTWRRRTVEKLPWFGLAAASAVATVLAQSSNQAVRSVAAVPPVDRIVNAIHSTLAYLGKLIAPLDLSVLYPHWSTTPGLNGPPAAQTAIELVILVAITALAFRLWRRNGERLPLAAWALWLILLAPVIGLIQVGDQAMADRYTYLPSIPVFAVFAGALVRMERSDPRARAPLALLAGLLLLACCLGSYRRAGVWRDSEALFRDALAYEDANPNAHLNLGEALSRRGDDEQAITHFESAARLQPGNPMAHFDLGNSLRDQGDLDAAERAYRTALDVDPGYAAAASNLGDLLARQGRFAEAADWFRRATKMDPTLAAAQINLARALLLTGDPGGAVDAASAALALDPSNAGYRKTLDEAQQALREKTENP